MITNLLNPTIPPTVPVDTDIAMKIAAIPGDGVGPEIMNEAVKLLRTVDELNNLGVEIMEFDLSAGHYADTGLALPDTVSRALSEQADAVLLGPLGDPTISDSQYAREVISGLVTSLDLSIILREVKLLSAELSPMTTLTEGDLDFSLITEGTTGFQSDLGGTVAAGRDNEVVVEQEVNTRQQIERAVCFAFDWAARHGRNRVTMVYGAKAQKHSQELWSRVFKEISDSFDNTSTSMLHTDAFIQRFVNTPDQLDVVVTDHMFGSVISSLATAFIGGHGLASVAHVNPDGKGLFRPLHPPSAKYAGKDYANPMGAMMSVSLLLELAGHERITSSIEASLKKALESGWTTRDLGGSMGTSEVGDYICSFLTERHS